MPKTKTVAGKASKSKKISVKGQLKSKAIKKTAPAEGGMKDKAKRHYKPGTVALREIKKYQKSMNMLLPRASFQRVVRQITQAIDPDLRF